MHNLFNSFFAIAWYKKDVLTILMTSTSYVAHSLHSFQQLKIILFPVDVDVVVIYV